MNKLEQLIQELCPDGVSYKSLGELGYFYGGLSGKCKDDFTNGNAKLITYMNVYTNIAIDIEISDLVKIGENEKQNTVQYGDILFTGSSETLDECGMSSVLTKKIDDKLYLNSFCFGFRLKDRNLLLPDFSKYLFRSNEVRKQIKRTANGVTRFNVSKKKMEQVVIPLPPLPVQREIARILDNFTGLTAELTAKLTEELTVRKKQYEYYRDLLLTFDDAGSIIFTDRQTDRQRRFAVQWLKLNELTVMKRGNYVTQKDTVQGEIPVILGGQKPAYYCDSSNHTGEAIVISRSGAYAGFVSFWNQPIFVTDGFIIETKDTLNIKFLYYYLKNMQDELHQMKRGGGVPHVRGNEIMEVKIPVPSLAEQERIVAILDRFDTLCNDLTSELPAEIEARRKQYEHYRDKLLTFKEMIS